MPPSLLHEALVDLFRTRPSLLTTLDVLPATWGPGRVVDATVGQLAPPEFNADLVLVFGDPPRLALALEVQLGRDPDKAYTWPLYAATLARRWRCPGATVVLTPDPRVARWASRHTTFGLECGEFQPHVLGPAAIPRITDAARAREEPGLAILSALAHGDSADGLAVLLAAMPMLAGLHVSDARIYYDLVIGRLSATRQAELETTMLNVPEPYIPTSIWGLRHFGAGKLEEAKLLVTRQLARRCGMLGPELQSRIEALELDSLEALCEALLDFNGPADLEAWLASDA